MKEHVTRILYSTINMEYSRRPVMADSRKQTIAGVCGLLIAQCLKKMHKSRQRSVWTKRWIARKRQQGAFDNLMRELALESNDDFRRWIRMDTSNFYSLLESISTSIKKSDTVMRESISPAERLSITLRYLATGESFSSLLFQYRVSAASICYIIPEVCAAIYECLSPKYLKVPDTVAEWERITNDFADMWNFPNCIGAIDGKHILMRAPLNSGSYYYNYKQTFSIVLLAVVDASLKFIYIDVGRNGRMSDASIWRKCTFKQAVESNMLKIPQNQNLPGTTINLPHVFVGDDAFPLEKYMMKPYPGRNLTRDKRIFNYRLSRARRVSENAFGVLSTVWRVLLTKIAVQSEKAELIVKCICVLHNYLRSKSDHVYIPSGSIDNEDITIGQISRGSWRNNNAQLLPLTPSNSHHSSNDAQSIRNEFCTYFNTFGVVSWQEKASLFH